MEIIILLISQVVFSLSRTLNVRYVSSRKILLVLITGLITKSTWLVSSAIGINSIINQDWINVFVYIVSGLIGDYIAMKIKIK